MFAHIPREKRLSGLFGKLACVKATLEKQKSDIDYIAMMTDTELEEETEVEQI